MQKARRFSNYGSNLRKNVRFEPNPIVKVSNPVSRVKMNATNGALDTGFLTTGDPCAVFPKNGTISVLTKPTLSYRGYCRFYPPGREPFSLLPCEEGAIAFPFWAADGSIPSKECSSCDCPETFLADWFYMESPGCEVDCFH